MTTLYVSILVQGPDRAPEVLEAIKSQITLDAIGPAGSISRYVGQSPSVTSHPSRASFSFFVELPK